MPLRRKLSGRSFMFSLPSTPSMHQLQFSQEVWFRLNFAKDGILLHTSGRCLFPNRGSETRGVSTKSTKSTKGADSSRRGRMPCLFYSPTDILLWLWRENQSDLDLYWFSSLYLYFFCFVRGDFIVYTVTELYNHLHFVLSAKVWK